MTKFQKSFLKMGLQYIGVLLVGCCVGTLIVFVLKYI